MSQRNSGLARVEGDKYNTPHWVTRALIPHLSKNISGVWECASGTGIMVDALQEAGFWVSATDIQSGVDFLTMENAPFACNAIITNPPYALATEFVEKALALMEPVGGTVAMLLRTDWDHARSRYHLFRDCRVYSRKVILTKRITWFDPGPGKKKGKSPSYNHAWQIWSWRHEGPPTIGYGP